MATNSYQNHSSLWFFGRTLLPSLSSVIGSFVVVLIIVGFHLLLLSNEADLFLPHVAGQSSDQLADVYNMYLLGPLNSLFDNNLLGVVSTAMVWGVAGWVIYAVLDFDCIFAVYSIV